MAAVLPRALPCRPRSLPCRPRLPAAAAAAAAAACAAPCRLRRAAQPAPIWPLCQCARRRPPCEPPLRKRAAAPALLCARRGAPTQPALLVCAAAPPVSAATVQGARVCWREGCRQARAQLAGSPAGGRAVSHQARPGGSRCAGSSDPRKRWTTGERCQDGLSRWRTDERGCFLERCRGPSRARPAREPARRGTACAHENLLKPAGWLLEARPRHASRVTRELAPRCQPRCRSAAYCGEVQLASVCSAVLKRRDDTRDQGGSDLWFPEQRQARSSA